MRVQNWLRGLLAGVWIEFWKLGQKGAAWFIWGAVFALVGGAITWWRRWPQDTVALPTWLVATLAVVFIISVAMSVLYILDRYRRRQRSDGDLPKRVEMRYGPWCVRVSRELLTDSYLDSGWLQSNWGRITPPLCPKCKAETIRYSGHGKWWVLGSCDCGEQIPGDDPGIRMDLDEFKLRVFKQLQRRHRAGRSLEEGTQLLSTLAELEDVGIMT